jgi:Flp pilus assembly pilin Flp
MKQILRDMRGAAAVEYVVAVCATAFLCWAAMSAFGQAAINGIKLAGLDLLGLS